MAENQVRSLAGNIHIERYTISGWSSSSSHRIVKNQERERVKKKTLRKRVFGSFPKKHKK